MPFLGLALICTQSPSIFTALPIARRFDITQIGYCQERPFFKTFFQFVPNVMTTFYLQMSLSRFTKRFGSPQKYKIVIWPNRAMFQSVKLLMHIAQ